MADNRVDELEEAVQQLEATAGGLTDELVETKERLRILEDELEPDMDPGIIEGGPTTPDLDVGNGADAGDDADGATTAASSTEADAGEASADADKGEELEGGDNVDGKDDDIIVA